MEFDITFVHEMLFTWLCTGVVAGVLYKLLYAPVTKLLDERAEKIHNELAGARRQLQEAEALKTEYEEALAEIAAKENSLINNALRRAANRERVIIHETRKEAKAIMASARLDIEAERENARGEMNRQIIEISTLLAGRFAAVSIGEAQKNELLEHALEELGESEWRI